MNLILKRSKLLHDFFKATLSPDLTNPYAREVDDKYLMGSLKRDILNLRKSNRIKEKILKKLGGNSVEPQTIGKRVRVYKSKQN